VKVNNNNPIIIQKLLACICPKEVHNELIKPIDLGGFDGARDSADNVVILETSMQSAKTLSKLDCENDQAFQGHVCGKCGVPAKVQESLNLKQMKLLKKLWSKINSTRERAKKRQFV